MNESKQTTERNTKDRNEGEGNRSAARTFNQAEAKGQERARERDPAAVRDYTDAKNRNGRDGLERYVHIHVNMAASVTHG